jgi:hypothetical protein
MIDGIEAYIGIGEMPGVKNPSTESIEEKMPSTGVKGKFFKNEMEEEE